MFNPPTKSEQIFWALFYTAIFSAGLFVLFLPPRTIEGPLGDALTFGWGVFLTTAIVLVVASILGRYKWEYATLPIVIAGVAIYASTIWYLALDTPSRGAQASLITALAIGLYRRWLDRRAWVRRDKQRQQRADPR